MDLGGVDREGNEQGRVVTLDEGGGGEEEGEEDGGEPNPNRHGRLSQIGSGWREEVVVQLVLGAWVFPGVDVVWLLVGGAEGVG